MEDKFILKLVFLVPLVSFSSAWIPRSDICPDEGSAGRSVGDGGGGWRCGHGSCISPMKRCDGQYDCIGKCESR